MRKGMKPLMFVAVVAMFWGCERLNLKPEPAESPLLLVGSLDGLDFGWNSDEHEMILRMDSTGSWCTFSIPMSEGIAELRFQVHPGAFSTIEQALDVELQTGVWPMSPMDESVGFGELEDLSLESFVLFNGEPIAPDAENLPFDFGATNVLLVAHDGACEAFTEMTWHPAVPCQIDWVEEPFSIEYEDDEVILSAPMPGVWQWQVIGGMNAVNDGLLTLPESDVLYSVALQPADLGGPYGNVQIVRAFPGNHDADCSEGFECELELEVGPFVSVRLIMPDGTEYTSTQSCATASGEFVASEVIPFDEADGHATRLVRFHCGLVLSHDGDEIVLDVEEGGVAFAISN
jgi:hypothetical protein